MFSSHVHTSHPVPLILKGDSGATNHYISSTSISALRHIKQNNGVKVSLPDNTILQSTHTGNLPLKHLSTAATTAHILPGLQNNSLLSLGQLGDDGCMILLSRQYMHVFKIFELILKGFRNNIDGLWDVPLQLHPNDKPNYCQTTPNKLNVITPVKQHSQTLIQYLHAALFSPAKSTIIKALQNNHFAGWPGLTLDNVHKYLQDTPATAKGHLDQHRKNLQSTRMTKPIDDNFPIQESTRSYQVAATIIQHTNKDLAYFDLTGAFPYTSARGHKYVFILYDYDTNAILAQPLKTRGATEIKNAWIKQHQQLIQCGCAPATYIMDYEASAVIKQATLKHNIAYQLTPPHIHRINAAERAIRTFKNHFIAGIATVDPTFPINEWDRLIPQAEITLNLLSSSQINPRLSSYATLYGTYDFNRVPLAPPGTRVVVHIKPQQRGSWSFHGEDGFYIRACS